jgi:hypothetical protein
MGPPIWTNGKRAPTETFKNDGPTRHYDVLTIQYVGPADTTVFGPCTFYVAEGL